MTAVSNSESFLTIQFVTFYTIFHLYNSSSDYANNIP